MATTKRDRQRANREQRQAELKKQRSREQLMTRAKRWSKIGLLLVAAFILSNAIVGSCGDEPTSTTTTTLVETTQAP
jgi:hypothetical protein